MKVLIVGSGGREHAIAWSVSRSPKADKIYCAPGNAGIAEYAECVNIGAMEFEKLADFAQENHTQYIAEEIKNMGFDGLRFRSSLNKNGFNVVLFNPDDCVAVSSDLVEVKGIDLKLDEPLIYKVGTPKLKEEMTNLDWMK